jgi:hypothetical protein
VWKLKANGYELIIPLVGGLGEAVEYMIDGAPIALYEWEFLVHQVLAGDVINGLWIRFSKTLKAVLNKFQIFAPEFYRDYNSADDCYVDAQKCMQDLLMHFCSTEAGIPLFDCTPDVFKQIMEKELLGMIHALYYFANRRSVGSALDFWSEASL